MKTLLMTGVILTISTCVAAQDPKEGCPWIDRTIPLGDSIYVKDPALIDMHELYLIDKGMNPDKAEKQAPRSDWVGYTLVCSQVFKPGPADGREGSVLALDGYALRLAEWHVGYWRSPEVATNNNR